MTDDLSYANLERHTLGGRCLDWYFWSTSSVDQRLQKLSGRTLEEVRKHALSKTNHLAASFQQHPEMKQVVPSSQAHPVA
jgi:hypothetical protein